MSELRDLLAEIDPDIILFDGLDDAIIGYADLKQSQTHVVVYSYEKIVKVHMDRDGMDLDEAREYVDLNIVGASLGDYTPVIVDVLTS